MRRTLLTALLAMALLATALGCLSAGGRIPEPPGGTTGVAPELALAFHQRADQFYGRLVQRRFNTLETFKDLVLRRHFRTVDGFYDYYADLAEKLDAAHFRKSRPLAVEVQEFLFEDPQRVRVQVRFVGRDGRPLRPNRTALIRLDQWEYADGDWWVAPGKL